jgi:hypothetical protein
VIIGFLIPWVTETGKTKLLCNQLEHALGMDGLVKKKPRQH